MVKLKPGAIWLLFIFLLAVIGLGMMIHYDGAVVFGVVKGDQDSAASIEKLFEFSDYPARLQVFQTYEDLAKAFQRRNIDYIIYSHTRENDEQLYKHPLTLSVNPIFLELVFESHLLHHYPSLLEIAFNPYLRDLFLYSEASSSKPVQLDVYFHRMVVDDYMAFRERFKTETASLGLEIYQDTFESYAELKQTPELFEIPTASHDIHAAQMIAHIFRDKHWSDEQNRAIPPGRLNEDYTTYLKHHKPFSFTVESIMRNRQFDRPTDHPFTTLVETYPNRHCHRASQLVEFEAEGSPYSKKASSLQELLFEVMKNRHQKEMDAVATRLNSTIICY